MNKNRNRAIVVAILAAVSVAYAFMVYLPQSRKLSDIRDQIARVSQQREQDDAQAAKIPQMMAEVADLKREFQDFDQRLPRRQELAGFLREIASTGAGQLNNQSIKPGNPSTDALYNRLPIMMDFSCTFTELVGFVGRLSSMTRLTRIEKITLIPQSNDEGTLDVRMQVNIYFTKT